MIVLARVGIMAFSTPCERARAVLDASIACKKSDPSCLQHQEPRTPPRTDGGELCLTDFPGRCPGLSTFGAFSADSIKRCSQKCRTCGRAATVARFTIAVPSTLARQLLRIWVSRFLMESAGPPHRCHVLDVC